MAAGPGFRPELDLLARTDTGVPVAALTAWFGGEGRCGMIEPMGTHHAHRRQGHGVRVLRGACAALAKLGAAGVTVMTPASSPAAVGVYRAAGFRSMGLLTAIVRPPR
jgi:GNAT superfamily N-acetyltransferase